MLSNDFYLFDAGWLFFAAWTVILAIVTVTAFARDLFPSVKERRKKIQLLNKKELIKKSKKQSQT